MSVEIVNFGVRRMYVFQVTDDTEGAPVYANGVRVKGVRKVGFPIEVAEAILKGDDTVIDYSSQKQSVALTAEYGGVDLVTQGLMGGGSVTEDPSPESTYLDDSVSDTNPQFGVIVKIAGRKGGAQLVILYNVAFTKVGNTEANIDAHGTSMLEGKGLPSFVDADRLLRRINYVDAADADINEVWTDNSV